MNCQDFEMIVLHLARNRWLEAATREQSRVHTEVCMRCAARLAEERALLDGVRLVIAEIAQKEAPAHVEAALLTAFRAQARCKEASTVRPLPEPGRWRRWMTGAAWAAVILLASLAGVTWLKLSSDGQKRAARQQPASAASPTPQREMTVANISEQKRSAVAQRVKPRRGLHQAAAPESEMTTSFYSLVEEGELAPLESGQVVRVEVPVSTLIALGLPVTAESLSQPVQADLLLGQDGLARAIRFSP